MGGPRGALADRLFIYQYYRCHSCRHFVLIVLRINLKIFSIVVAALLSRHRIYTSSGKGSGYHGVRVGISKIYAVKIPAKKVYSDLIAAEGQTLGVHWGLFWRITYIVARQCFHFHF